MSEIIFHYEFSRENIEAGNLQPDLDRLNEWITSSHSFSEKLHRVIFTIQGYDHDPRPLNRIPEVKRFITVLYKQWPYLFNFAYPEPSNFELFFIILVTKPVSEKTNQVLAGFIDAETLQEFFNTWFAVTNQITAFLRIDENLYQERQKEMIAAINHYISTQSI